MFYKLFLKPFKINTILTKTRKKNQMELILIFILDAQVT